MITGFTAVCPRCHRQRLELIGLWDGMGRAVRAADLSAEDLTVFAEYLHDVPADVTPEQLAAEHPGLAPIINYTVNNFGGDSAWLQVLGWVIAALIAIGVGYWAHTDAEQAAGTDRTSQNKPPELSEKDIEKIAAEVEAKLANRNQQQPERKPNASEQRGTATGHKPSASDKGKKSR